VQRLDLNQYLLNTDAGLNRLNCNYAYLIADYNRRYIQTTVFIPQLTLFKNTNIPVFTSFPTDATSGFKPISAKH
jgi:hypothetical protein